MKTGFKFVILTAVVLLLTTACDGQDNPARLVLTSKSVVASVSKASCEGTCAVVFSKTGCLAYGFDSNKTQDCVDYCQVDVSGEYLGALERSINERNCEVALEASVNTGFTNPLAQAQDWPSNVVVKGKLELLDEKLVQEGIEKALTEQVIIPATTFKMIKSNDVLSPSSEIYSTSVKENKDLLFELYDLSKEKPLPDIEKESKIDNLVKEYVFVQVNKESGIPIQNAVSVIRYSPLTKSYFGNATFYNVKSFESVDKEFVIRLAHESADEKAKTKKQVIETEEVVYLSENKIGKPYVLLRAKSDSGLAESTYYTYDVSKHEVVYEVNGDPKTPHENRSAFVFKDDFLRNQVPQQVTLLDVYTLTPTTHKLVHNPAGTYDPSNYPLEYNFMVKYYNLLDWGSSSLAIDADSNPQVTKPILVTHNLDPRVTPILTYDYEPVFDYHCTRNPFLTETCDAGITPDCGIANGDYINLFWYNTLTSPSTQALWSGNYPAVSLATFNIFQEESHDAVAGVGMYYHTQQWLKWVYDRFPAVRSATEDKTYTWLNGRLDILLSRWSNRLKDSSAGYTHAGGSGLFDPPYSITLLPIIFRESRLATSDSCNGEPVIALATQSSISNWTLLHELGHLLEYRIWRGIPGFNHMPLPSAQSAEWEGIWENGFGDYLASRANDKVYLGMINAKPFSAMIDPTMMQHGSVCNEALARRVWTDSNCNKTGLNGNYFRSSTLECQSANYIASINNQTMCGVMGSPCPVPGAYLLWLNGMYNIPDQLYQYGYTDPCQYCTCSDSPVVDSFPYKSEYLRYLTGNSSYTKAMVLNGALTDVGNKDFWWRTYLPVYAMQVFSNLTPTDSFASYAKKIRQLIINTVTTGTTAFDRQVATYLTEHMNVFDMAFAKYHEINVNNPGAYLFCPNKPIIVTKDSSYASTTRPLFEYLKHGCSNCALTIEVATSTALLDSSTGRVSGQNYWSYAVTTNPQSQTDNQTAKGFGTYLISQSDWTAMRASGTTKFYYKTSFAASQSCSFSISSANYSFLAN